MFYIHRNRIGNYDVTLTEEQEVFFGRLCLVEGGDSLVAQAYLSVAHDQGMELDKLAESFYQEGISLLPFGAQNPEDSCFQDESGVAFSSLVRTYLLGVKRNSNVFGLSNRDAADNATATAVMFGNQKHMVRAYRACIHPLAIEQKPWFVSGKDWIDGISEWHSGRNYDYTKAVIRFVTTNNCLPTGIFRGASHLLQGVCLSPETMPAMPEDTDSLNALNEAYMLRWMINCGVSIVDIATSCCFHKKFVKEIVTEELAEGWLKSLEESYARIRPVLHRTFDSYYLTTVGVAEGKARLMLESTNRIQEGEGSTVLSWIVSRLNQGENLDVEVGVNVPGSPCLKLTGYDIVENIESVNDLVNGTETSFEAELKAIAEQRLQRFMSNPIYGYSYKPAPTFWGEAKRYYGIELELGADTDDEDEVIDIARRAYDMGRDMSIYIKNDNSIDVLGFEIVSQPMSKDMVHERLSKVIERISDSVYPHYTCGLHVHISKHTDDAVNERFVKMFYDRINSFINIAGRQPNSFCEVPSGTQRYGASRYEALNILNPNTLEFRLGASTLSIEKIDEIVEALDNLMEGAEQYVAAFGST